jgi:hypothetical protein
MTLVRFMQSTVGRAARIGVGLALIGTGVAIGGAGWILAVVGLVPIAAGTFGFCLVGPLLHAPLRSATHR